MKKYEAKQGFSKDLPDGTIRRSNQLEPFRLTKKKIVRKEKSSFARYAGLPDWISKKIEAGLLDAFIYGGDFTQNHKGQPMKISVVHDDESENELEIELCCATCCKRQYNWSQSQFNTAYAMANSNSPIKLPVGVDNDTKFVSFIRSL